MEISDNPTVGIIGTGPIGLGCAAVLSKNAINSFIWSPTGSFPERLELGQSVRVTGAVEIEFVPAMVLTAQKLVEVCDIIVLAIPAYGHKMVLDQIALNLRSDQTVIISSHVPFASEYLHSILEGKGITPLIIALSTTIVAGRKKSPLQVNLSTLRDRVDIATLPAEHAELGLGICQQLFGDRFVLRDGLMAISLSNLNPQNHLGIALCNLTRIEKGETWIQAENITPAVGRLLEKLDGERLAIGQALNLKLRNIYEHFSWSFHVEPGSVADMSAAMVKNGQCGYGPTNMETRYVLEDVPYGLVPIAWLGRQVGVRAPLHEAGITLFNALYDCNFYAMNDLMMGLETMGKSDDNLLKLLQGETGKLNRLGRIDRALEQCSNYKL